MKCIFGNVVGRKFQKVSHKIAKVRCTKKNEHIVLENMHEPIIDLDTWNKAQDKLNGFNKVRDRKYDHELKGLVYCGECGNKATLRCREEKRKNGTIWRAEYFICSKRNNYSGLCDCKQISANLVQEEITKQLKKEIAKINLSEEEFDAIPAHTEKLNEQNIEETYQDKINKIIQVDDFKIIYEKMQKQRAKILKEIKQTESMLNQNSERIPKIDFEKIKSIADEFLKMENPNKIVLEQLVEKIEFDKEKNIKIKFVFQNEAN